MTGKPLPQARTEPERKVVADVQQHGWHVIKVLPEGDTPGWAYTIGLFHTFGHPEIILFGLPLDTAHVLLNTAGAAIRAGKVFQPDVPYDDFVQGYDCVLKPTAAVLAGSRPRDALGTGSFSLAESPSTAAVRVVGGGGAGRRPAGHPGRRARPRGQLPMIRAESRSRRASDRPCRPCRGGRSCR